MTDGAVLHYRILEKLGEGGMGVVYKALDTRLDRTVAIKTLPSLDPKRRRQFLWEARAAAGLRHPNIVVVHDLVVEGDSEFIVMEYIPGRPLSECLENGPLPLDTALAYAREIASALETAHAAGIVHRDLKPSNILVTPEGSIKLVDFGLALLQQQDIAGAPPAGGTFGYISPEQAAGERATAQSDVFSFGAVLFEMVTGRRAIDGRTATCVLEAVSRELPAAGSLVSDVPPALDKIVQQCLRQDPKRRFQHMGDVRLALEEVEAGAQLQESRVSWWRRGLIAGALTAILLAGWLVLGSHSLRDTPSNPIPLTSFTGREEQPAWSPDGRQVAFVWTGEKDDRRSIYVVQPGSTQVLRLTSGPGSDSGPAWSPDSRWIAYAHAARGCYYLELVSPLGGPSRMLLMHAWSLGSPSWSPDGRMIVLKATPDRDRSSELWVLDVETGAHFRLTSPPEGIPGDLTPALSPDGRTLAFTRKTAWHTSELYLLDLKRDLHPAGAPRQVTKLGYVGRPAWTPDGERILFEASAQEGDGLWQIDRGGRHPRPVFGVPETAGEPAIARRPDGHWSLVFMNEVGDRKIRRYPTEVNSQGAVAELVPSSREQSHPRYSPDGKRLAFSSTRSRFQEIWMANADGSQPVQLTDLRHQLTEVGHWSPDGALIAFVSQDRGHRNIYTIASSGGPPVAITNDPGVRNGSGWSHDGAAYYYTATHSGRDEVWKVPRGGGRPEQAATGWGGFESGAGVFYYWREVPGRGALLMQRTALGERELPLGPRAPAHAPMWPARTGFYFRAQGKDDIYLYDETRGEAVEVLKRPPEFFNAFCISPDGEWFVSDFMGKPSVDLMLMEHFR